MMHFCTLFDKNYLSRGLTLYDSLIQQKSEFHLFILCLDEFTYNYLDKKHLNNVELIPLHELELSDKEMAYCQHNRSRVEYYFTMSPCLPLYLLNKYPDLPYICSIDADLYFYDDPHKILQRFEDYSILMTSHHFSPDLGQHWHHTGIYNVSFQAFRNDLIGKKCLEKWREQCINWCGNYYDALHDRFADQKYLENWPQTYGEKLIILETADTNLALWNVNQYDLKYNNKHIFVDNLPLVFYHFSNVKIVNSFLIQCGFYWASTKPRAILLQKIYLPYIQKLIKLNRNIFGNAKDVIFQNESKKRFALVRRAMRDRGLLFLLKPFNTVFYQNFSLINDIYETCRSRFNEMELGDWASKEILSYEKNKK